MAVPDSLRDENNDDWWLYHYYYETRLLDYDEVNDSIFYPKSDRLAYKLKDTYFFDINGDGLVDIFHYPMYYRMLMTDFDTYDIFINNGTGYKRLWFQGFITDITFNSDNSLSRISTCEGPCCDDDHATYRSYKFDRTMNELTVLKQETIQLQPHR